MLLCLTLNLPFNARSQERVAEVDLSPGWKSINTSGEAITYQRNLSRIIFFNPDELENQHRLKISSNQPIDIWINEQLIIHGLEGVVLLDSMVSRDALKDATVTIYCEDGIDDNVTTSLISPENANIKVIQWYKSSNSIRNWFLIALTILLLMGGVFRYYFPLAFGHVFKNPLSGKMRSLSAEESYLNFGSLDNIYVLIYFSFLLATLLLYLGTGRLLDTSRAITGIFYFWIVLFVIIILTVLAKYVWMRILGFIYQFQKIALIQLQDRINFFIPVIIICLAISILDYSFFAFTSVKLHNTAIYAMIISEIFFSIWFYFKFDKSYPHRKLMIITYLCTTEFLPGTLAIYWLEQLK